MHPIPNHYHEHALDTIKLEPDQLVADKVYSVPTQISLFNHSEWLRKGVSPFNASYQNAGTILGYGNFHVRFSPPASPKWAEPISSRLMNGCATVNFVYRNDRYLVTQTYKSFDYIDHSLGSTKGIVDFYLCLLRSLPSYFL